MLGDGLSLAAVNGRSSCVVSGPDVAIAELERRLAERSIATKSLRTSHAFHSAMMDPIVDAFACVAAGVSLAAEDPRRVERHWDLAHCGRGDGSGVLGETSPADRALRRRGDPSGQSADCVLLEVGPGRTLASFATRPGTPSPVTTLRQRDEAGDDRAHLLKALGSLWACGGRVPGRPSTRVRTVAGLFCRPIRSHDSVSGSSRRVRHPWRMSLSLSPSKRSRCTNDPS